MIEQQLRDVFRHRTQELDATAFNPSINRRGRSGLARRAVVAIAAVAAMTGGAIVFVSNLPDSSPNLATVTQEPPAPSPPPISYAMPPANSLENRLWRLRGSEPYDEVSQQAYAAWAATRGVSVDTILGQPLLTTQLPSGVHVFAFQINVLSDESQAYTVVYVRNAEGAGQIVLDEVLPLDTPAIAVRIPDRDGSAAVVLGEPNTRIIEYAADGRRYMRPTPLAGTPNEGWLIFRVPSDATDAERVRTARCSDCPPTYNGRVRSSDRGRP